MSSSPYHISNLLEKMSSSDKDFRFMATNDLMSELQKDSIKLDDESEKKVLKMLLKLLEDKNGEVQNLAVKCLGPLVAKIKEYQIETIVETLCSNMLSKKEQLRDISSIGIKTVINELPSLNPSMVANICKKITSRLTTAVSNASSSQDDVSVQMEALDILGDLLHRHGTLLSSFHNQVLDSLLPLLKSPRMAVRKRTITAISNLVVTCNSTVFGLLISHIVSQLQAADGSINNDKFCQTYVQCTGAVTRQAGHKIGQYLDQLMPLISNFCQQKQENDELKEHCIQAFELFIRKCPLEVTSYIDGIITLCLEYLTYDPNYNYDSDECEESMEEEEDDDDDLDDYSDDDDISWKVRRACAKCIEAIASTRQELLCNLYTTISQPLIARFKEREENVKADIFNAYISLVKYTKYVATPSGKENSEVDANMSMETEDTPLSLLLGQVPSLVKAIFVHLKEKSIKTRECCFSLLTQLVLALPACLADHLESLVPGIQHSLSSDRHNTSNMKINTLHFLHILLKHHDHKVIKPYVHILVPAVVTTSQDSFYKITSDALNVMQDLIKVVCSGECDETSDEHIVSLYNATVVRLRASDIDQEVKERAIMCMGQIISCAGHRLSGQVPGTLEIFLDRLRNEITRLTTVRALHMIASATVPTKVPLDSILSDAMPVLANFLRKNQRSLRIASLQCLHSIFTNYGSDIKVYMIRSVEREVPPLITENDLYISQLAIRLLTLMLNTPLQGAWPSVNDERPNLKEDIMPNTYAIVQSSLLQGYALNAVLEFLRTLVTCDALCQRESPVVDELTFRYILRMLIEPIYKPNKQAARQTNRTSLSPSASSQPAPLTKQACHSTAKCIASLTKAQPQECEKIVHQFMMDVCDQKSSDSIRMFALLSIGEIGIMIDLSSFTELEKIVMKCFNASSEEVKSAASFSLGRVAIGNLKYYLPTILNEVKNQPKSQYLLLHALKETITHSPLDQLKNFVGDIWKLLFQYCECTEEGTRNIVAECLGKMTIIQPETLLPELRSNLRSSKALVRATMVTAFKFTITDQPLPVDPMLKECIGEFLALLLDSEINVCRVTLTMFNSAAHNKPSLIRDLLPEVLPHLYNETKIRKELIREVLMGPFRHTVDDGLDVRKAAFECMYTLLDTCVAQLDIFQFITYMESGLKDSYDIKMLTFLMLVRLSNICPNVVLQHLDRLIEPIRATCTVKVKADSVKQEFEKQDELKRSALRAIHALLNIPEADKSPAMSEFLAQVSSSSELTQMFESVQKDFAAAMNPSASQTQYESMDTS